jgi:PAS domain S-box-containing protein
MLELRLLARVISAVSGAGLLALAVRASAGDRNAATSSFALLVSVLGVAALCGSVTAHTGVGYKLVWLVTTLAVPLALARFAFDYYGLRYLDSPARLAAASAPVVAGVLGGSLLILGRAPSGTPAVPALATLPPVVFEAGVVLERVGTYYAAGVLLVSVGLVLRTVRQYRHLDSRLGPVIAFIGLWPWLAYFAMPVLSARAALDSALVAVTSGYVGSFLAAGSALGPLGLFASTPAAATVGPETVLDSMDDAVFVVDDDGHLLRTNAAAREAFGLDDGDAVGRPLEALLGRPAADIEGTVSLETVEGSRTFEVSRSPVAGRVDGRRGTALLVQDVTRRRTREQRLEVLNRVLRHNLRNDATTIIGRAELIGDGGDPETAAETIADTTRDLVGAADRAREVEGMMEAPRAETPTAVAPVVEDAIEEVTATHRIEVTAAVPDGATAMVNPRVLRTVLSNLIENAAEHNDAEKPIAVVSADRREGSLAVSVADNGPGIPDHERSVLKANGESQLQHGSGLGLWAVRWGVTRMGGSLAFTGNEPRGTVVTVDLPTSPEESVSGAPLAE